MPIYRFSIRSVTDEELDSQVPGAVSINASGPEVYVDVNALAGSFADLTAFMQSKGFVYVTTDPIITPSDAGSSSINHNVLLNLSANDHPQYQLTSGKGAANGYAGLDASSIIALANIPVIDDTKHGSRGGGSLHSAATTSVAGFMSGGDKTKLDGIATGATNTPLTASAPANVTKSAAVVGVATDAARADHKHDITTAAASSLTATTTNTEGTATSLARSDHTHSISSAAPSALTVGGSNVTGTSSDFSRADHIHALPAFGSIAGTFTEGNDSRLSNARTPTSHAASHQDGGGDEISVAGLSGQLADAQKVTVRVNGGSDLGPQARLNFIAGTNVTLSGANDGINNEVDITINATGGGGGGTTITSDIVSVDFGVRGDNIETTIIGQAGILSTSKIKAWISGVATSDHTSDEHAIISPYISCIIRNIVVGVGFDILVVSSVVVSGQFNIQWEWYN